MRLIRSFTGTKSLGRWGSKFDQFIFTPGNQTVNSIIELAGGMGRYTLPVSPTSGGTLNVNGVSLGNYDYTIKQGNQTISSFVNTDWFTTTADTVSAWIAINGNLTIDAGQTLIPSNRKLFTVLYVNGSLTVNGSISMSSRGASHSATPAGSILLASGTYGGVSNPQIPASGGAGAPSVINYGNGVAGTAGTNGGTGGGGSGGGYQEGGGSTSGAGAPGTSFSGGPGGGAVTIFVSSAGSGSPNGGAGGNGAGSYYGAGGGAGNPGGSGGPGGSSGSSGTGGVLIIICTGALSGSGSITANGANGGAGGYNGKPDAGGTNGASSGGGSITVFYGADSSSITPVASGGATITASGTLATGGAGGAGTARKLSL